MSEYDFKSLSPYDFELLVRDLLQEELGVTFENFKSGRDKGIDLRYSLDKSETIIVQCKHYAGSGYSALYSHLKLEEAPKVETLKPTRYLLATSVGLTPDNKTALFKLFEPYCLTPGDIYGKESLNNLLGKYSQIEKKNFKLWLTSTAVLERVLQSSVFNQSEVEVESIQRKLKLYIANESFEEAKRILENSHYCIVAGIPGIGKTTLAEVLIVDYLARDYEVIKVTSNISEAYGVYRPNAKQLFYYDDFLGRTGLGDKLGKNEDQALLKFIEAINHSKDSRLILTTREYILNQAKSVYEGLAASKFDAEKCVIALANYTEIQKAKILFNHVYFSNLSDEHKADLLKGKNYLKIIKHPNYNPRVIEMMTGFASEPEEPQETYTDTFLRNLNNPSGIWEHAFYKHISEAARHLLTVLLTLPNAVRDEDLRDAFDAYYLYRARWYGFPTSPGQFLEALRELDGNFISILARDSYRFITTHNPSILDFLHTHVEENQETVQHLIDSSVFFEQCERLWGKSQYGVRISRPLNSITRKFPTQFLNSLIRTFKSISLRSYAVVYAHGGPSRSLEGRMMFTIQVAESLQTEEAYSAARQVLAELVLQIQQNDGDKDALFGLLRKLTTVSFDYGIQSNVLLRIVKEFFFREIEDLDDFARLLEFNRSFEGVISDEDFQKVGILFRQFLEQRIEDDVEALDRSDEVESFAESLESVADAFGCGVEDHLLSLDEMALEMKAKEYEEERQDYFADLHREDFGPRAVSSPSSESIDSMFESLSTFPTSL